MSFLSRGRVNDVKPFIDRRAAELVAQLGDGEVHDFVTTVGDRLPIEVIAVAMGLSEDAAVRLRELTVNMWLELSAGHPGGPAFQELSDLFSTELSSRRLVPRDDFLDYLLRVEVKGSPLTDEQRANYLRGAAVAGHETTVNAASNLVIELVSVTVSSLCKS